MLYKHAITSLYNIIFNDMTIYIYEIMFNYKNIFLFIIMNSRIKSTTCTFCEDQCAIEFQKYQELLQYEKTISGCEQKPKYQSRDAVKFAYCRFHTVMHQ